MYTDLWLYMSNALRKNDVSFGAFDTARRMIECTQAFAVADLPHPVSPREHNG
ncbi:hypothetical protein PWG15_02555 [Ensifer adhaerens]|uniref:hypothetical protein n=1 Tax=Ensifer adhaerens TaxID=106592 RepID=UPI0023A94FF0|nr:hypothetical protein [Ensifer adhaerens]WDZ77418.1 hypothetical protein PWG15_02555 [Ensifer adhaerens]